MKFYIYTKPSSVHLALSLLAQHHCLIKPRNAANLEIIIIPIACPHEVLKTFLPQLLQFPLQTANVRRMRDYSWTLNRHIGLPSCHYASWRAM